MNKELERLMLLLRRDNLSTTNRYMSDKQLEDLVNLLNSRCQHNNVLANKWMLAKSDVFPDSPAMAIINGQILKVINYLKYFK